MMVNPLVTASLVMVLSACASFGPLPRAPRIDNAQLPAAATQTIVADLVEQLALELGQGEANLVLDGTGSEFARQLEAALRLKGYAVAPRASAGADWIEVGYVLEPFEEGVLVRLALPNASMGRLYLLDAETATLAGPLAISRSEG